MSGCDGTIVTVGSCDGGITTTGTCDGAITSLSCCDDVAPVLDDSFVVFEGVAFGMDAAFLTVIDDFDAGGGVPPNASQPDSVGEPVPQPSPGEEFPVFVGASALSIGGSEFLTTDEPPIAPSDDGGDDITKTPARTNTVIVPQ